MFMTSLCTSAVRSTAIGGGIKVLSSLTSLVSVPSSTSLLPQPGNQSRRGKVILRGMSSQTKSTIVSTEDAPKAIGPYSQAIKTANGLVFSSGCIPLDPKTMEIVGENDVQAQTEQCLKNLESVLKASGSCLNSVVKTTVYIKDMNQFSKINEVYSKFFKDFKPARSCVEVARLPKDVLVEIEAIATVI